MGIFAFVLLVVAAFLGAQINLNYVPRGRVSLKAPSWVSRKMNYYRRRQLEFIFIMTG